MEIIKTMKTINIENNIYTEISISINTSDIDIFFKKKKIKARLEIDEKKDNIGKKSKKNLTMLIFLILNQSKQNIKTSIYKRIKNIKQINYMIF